MEKNCYPKPSIMNPVRNVTAALFTTVALVAVVAWHPAAQAQAVAATPSAKPAATGLIDPFEVKGENWRRRPFYEILFMNREANGSGIGNYFNSLGNTFDVAPEVTDAKFRALNAEVLAKGFGSDGVFFNGSRRYVANGFTAIAYNGGQKPVMGTPAASNDGTSFRSESVRLIGRGDQPV